MNYEATVSAGGLSYRRRAIRIKTNRRDELLMILSTASIADRLIKEHGELAPGVAAKHACKLQKAGDEIRSRQWTKVMIESKFLLARDYAE